MEKEIKSGCKHLRTKTAYVQDANDAERWRSNRSTTAQYWCLCTMATSGPDNDFVAPEMCQPVRSCYVDVELVS